MLTKYIHWYILTLSDNKFQERRVNNMIKIIHLSGDAFTLLVQELGDPFISVDDCDEDLDVLDVTLSPDVIMKVNTATKSHNKSVIFERGGWNVMIDFSEFKEITIA